MPARPLLPFLLLFLFELSHRLVKRRQNVAADLVYCAERVVQDSGGWRTNRLQPQVHLGLRRMRHRVANERHLRVLVEDVAQRVADRVVLFVEGEGGVRAVPARIDRQLLRQRLSRSAAIGARGWLGHWRETVLRSGPGCETGVHTSALLKGNFDVGSLPTP
eukprot:scaffold29784_cov55-Phaeocystis_antarctica.AAC.4